MRGVYILACALVWAAPGCTGDIDPPWQLDHTRIIAVRATPPQIAAGEQAVLAALISSRSAPVAERSPDDAIVVSPPSLAGAITQDAGRWVVTAPSSEVLAAVRAQLGLPADALVPLEAQVAYAGGSLLAIKTVWLGGTATNPAITDVEIDHVTASTDELVVALHQDIPLSIGLDDTHYDINWLSSCGTMHDFDLSNAYLRIEVGDVTSGELALVVRDRTGGVSWRVWPIRTD